MLEELEEKLPREAIWIDLMEALTWAVFRHSVSLPEFLVSAGPQPTDFGAELQDTWRDIADQGTVGRIQIRGKRDRAHDEQDLNLDDLRNCRFLAWTPFTDPDRKVVLRVERYPDTYKWHWERLDKEPPGFDYYDVVVRRAQLMDLYPREKPSLRKLKAKVGAEKAASDWLAHFCDSNPRGSKTRDELVREIRDEFHLSLRRARIVWDGVTAGRPAWRRPGRPPKTVRKNRTQIKL